MSVQTVTVAAHYPDEIEDALPAYAEILGLIERLHRQQLDIVKRALDASAIHDINAVQAMIIFNVGDATVSAGDLVSRGHYQGTNVSYNLRKLSDMGYVSCAKSSADRRVVRVSLTEKAINVRLVVADLLQRHAQEVTNPNRLGRNGVDKVRRGLRALESYWNEEVRAHI